MRKSAQAVWARQQCMRPQAAAFPQSPQYRQSGIEPYAVSSRACNDLRLGGQCSVKTAWSRWRRVRLLHGDVTIGAVSLIFAVAVWRSRGAAL